MSKSRRIDSKLRRERKEQKFIETLETKTTNYYLCLAGGQVLKLSENFMVRVEEAKLILQQKSKIVRKGLYAYKELFFRFIDPLYHRCTAVINYKEPETALIKVLDEYRQYVPNDVARDLKCNIGRLMQFGLSR